MPLPAQQQMPAVDSRVRAVDDNTLLEFTGQTAIRDPSETAQRCVLTESRLAALKVSELEIVQQRRLAAIRYFFARFGMSPVLDALLVSSVVSVAMALALIGAAASLAVVIVGTAGTYAFMGLGLAWVCRDRSPVEIGDRLGIRKAHLQSFTKSLGDLRQSIGEATAQLHRERDLHERLIAAVNARINRLLSANCSAMNGTEFEAYLCEVFDYLGYNVQALGGSGDQGVDLIVERDGIRTAVQAKCHAGSINNSAVQQAQTGMQFHKCQRCAVVTNSVMTQGGRELARGVGCAVIEGRHLRSLIQGRIEL